MPVIRSLLRVLPVILAAAFLAVPVGAAAPEPVQPPAANKPTEDGDVEVKCIDSSVMRLKLLDDKVELTTRHGVLRIATAEIRRIEFSTRIPPDVTEKVAAAIGRLNHSDFKVREAATEELKRYKARAYPQVLKVLKSEDPEVNQRAEEIVKFIRAKVPSAMLEIREFDVIHTDDSKIAGRLTAEYLKVGTSQFGEQRLKLTDMYSLRTGANTEELIAATPGPAHLANYQNQFGKEYVFTVTGAVPGGVGSVWGSDVYTLDSHLPSAVVHAGLAKAGETVTVKVRIIQSPAQFAGGIRNGINSAPYERYPGGAYEFVRK
jgi:hypothetical protein